MMKYVRRLVYSNDTVFLSHVPCYLKALAIHNALQMFIFGSRDLSFPFPWFRDFDVCHRGISEFLMSNHLSYLSSFVLGH